MTKNEIIEMARQASAGNDDRNIFFEFVVEELETFAKLVAAKKQEDIIQIIKETPFSNWFQTDVIEAIRARGDA